MRSPGEYVLWHEGGNLPTSFAVTVRAPGGTALAVELPGSQTWTDSSVMRTAAARFTATDAGRHTIEVTGDFARRTMAVSPDFFMSMLASIVGAIVLVLAGVAGGIGVAVYALARRADAARPVSGAAQAPVPESEKSLRELANVVYALQAVSFVTGITLIAGVIINYLKRDAVAGTWLESHFRWQIRTFWWTLAWGAVGFVTAIVLVGFLVWFAAAVWLIYRIVKGWLRLNEGRPAG